MAVPTLSLNMWYFHPPQLSAVPNAEIAGCAAEEEAREENVALKKEK